MNDTNSDEIEIEAIEQGQLFETEATKQVGPPAYIKGTDFLNLAEFPLALLSKRPAEGIKTIEFKDYLYDKSEGKEVQCKVIVTGSDKFGLTKTVDEEVLLALIQITQKDGFRSRKVQFTRYEIIETLGWTQCGPTYRRIDESLDRWAGITLIYKNAWWLGETEGFSDKTFHVIEDVSVHKKANGGEVSSITWSEHMWQDVKSKRMRDIDIGIHNELKLPLAKRMYRWLDKTFAYTSRVEKDIRDLICDKFGMWRDLGSYKLKQKLLAALADLERVGYIKPMDPKERYYKERKGKWVVIIEKAKSETLKLTADAGKEERHPIHEKLLEIGVTPKEAVKILSEFDIEYIDRKIQQLEYVMEQRGDAIVNPPGMLILYLRGRDITEPNDFKTREEKAAETDRREERKRRRQREKRMKAVDELKKFILRAIEKMADEIVYELAAGMSEETEAELTEYINKLMPADIGSFRIQDVRTEVVKIVPKDDIFLSSNVRRLRNSYFREQYPDRFATVTIGAAAESDSQVRSYDEDLVLEAVEQLQAQVA